MVYRATHVTSYAYAEPVPIGHNEVRLTPRSMSHHDAAPLLILAADEAPGLAPRSRGRASGRPPLSSCARRRTTPGARVPPLPSGLARRGCRLFCAFAKPMPMAAVPGPDGSIARLGEESRKGGVHDPFQSRPGVLALDARPRSLATRLRKRRRRAVR
ncbi:transglutaminase N-terminal domain-containing protein [Sorangium sp. So ce693]|uniref:transglutaminase N-terminal domain-containing protein n=1 Tax=Sorangium sp. So ce693 TaxID=3133318 RepID=UPI003F5FA4E1